MYIASCSFPPVLLKLQTRYILPTCFRLRTHYASYEPTLRQLKQKYESAMKEKMLTRLERDRAVGQVQGLQSTLKNLDSMKAGTGNAQGDYKLYCCVYVTFRVSS